jgi:hypothetical protein
MKMRFAAPAAMAAFAGVLLLSPLSAQAAPVDFDCTDFSDQATAQEYLHPGDPHALDLDGNGIACEGLPCPCAKRSTGSGQKAPRSPHLAKADARLAARKITREFARSDDSVSTVAIDECQRRAPHRVDCRAVSRGKTTTTKTICRLRIAVRATSGNPHAGLLSSKCWTSSRLKLTEADALAAFTDGMQELVGQPIQITRFARMSRASFSAIVEWTRPGATGGTDRCIVLLVATRQGPGIVELSAHFPSCQPAPTL